MSTVSTNGPTKSARTVTSAPAYTAQEPLNKGSGWIIFAAIMFIIAAGLNIIWGLAAVAESSFFVNGARYIIGNLNTWGWIVMGFGALQLAAGFSILRGGAYGRWFGIFAAVLAILPAMLTIPAYPFWSLTLVAIDFAIIYGLVVYGGKPELVE